MHLRKAICSQKRYRQAGVPSAKDDGESIGLGA